SESPELDAELIHSFLLATEVRLLAHPEWADEKALNKRMHHLLEKLVPHG
ncbi:MAG TPA: TetR family transcriptional regulator, partial [Alcanivorax sp.]|nr:TetR family transcriptional regulator [Alcanivorax sp.]